MTALAVSSVAFVCLVFAWVAYQSLKGANEARRLEEEQRDLSDALKQSIIAERNSKAKIIAAAEEVRKQRNEANRMLTPDGVADAIRNELHKNSNGNADGAGHKDDAVPAATEPATGNVAETK